MTTRAAVGQACVFLLKTPPTPFASAVDAIKRDAKAGSTTQCLRADGMTDAVNDFRAMIDKIPALAWSCRPDGSTEFLNQRWLDYTGLSMEESLGWGWQAAIHRDDLGTLMDTWLRVLASEDRKSTRLNSSHSQISYAVFCLKKKKITISYSIPSYSTL